MTGFDIKKNNFDLLRLFAATQVMLVHILEQLKFSDSALFTLLNHFPGVPVFFTISGFLISASYERNSNLKHYFTNRALRIFPALWACLFISVCIVIFIGHVNFSFRELAVWIAAQATIVQFYNPEFNRGFGIGVINGSLWTISTELQFYLAIPVFYILTKNYAALRNKILLVCLFIFAIFNLVVYHYAGIYEQMPQYHAISKFVRIMLPTHLYLFIIGILLQRNYQKLKPYLENKAVLWVLLYLASSLAIHHFGGVIAGNKLHPVIGALLAIATISSAVTLPNLSHKILRGDISYGIYIYHALLINIFVQFDFVGHYRYVLMAVAITYFLALASWLFIEKPALSLKRSALHKA